MDVSILLVPPGCDPGQIQACLDGLERTLPPGLRGEVVLCTGEDVSPPAGTVPVVLPGAAHHLAAARNAAVRASQAPVLCFLSPGATPQRDWLPPMLALLRDAPLAGCVGNVHREPYSGLIDHAGVRFAPDGAPTAGPGGPLLPENHRDRHPAVSMACAVMSRRLFDQVGGFDERFHGPLGDVDFCLRAASAGRRHYVANRSVVYHDARSLPDPFPAADAARFRQRWGERAAAALRRRREPGPAYSREAWEMAREARRLWRREARETRGFGLAYLGKHLHRPWRYNYGRICRALEQVLPPSLAALPPTPGAPFDDVADLTRADDGWLFDPPPQ